MSSTGLKALDFNIFVGKNDRCDMFPRPFLADAKMQNFRHLEKNIFFVFLFFWVSRWVFWIVIARRHQFRADTWADSIVFPKKTTVSKGLGPMVDVLIRWGLCYIKLRWLVIPNSGGCYSVVPHQVQFCLGRVGSSAVTKYQKTKDLWSFFGPFALALILCIKKSELSSSKIGRRF